MDTLRLLAGLRFVSRVPGFLAHPLTDAEARAWARRQREHRETAFLTLVRRGIYEHPGSPYRVLLRHAGCEPGDLAGLVTREGLEAALHALLRQGVYLTGAELKGRVPVRRGSTTVTVAPGSLRNPALRGTLARQTSGSRGPRTTLAVDLASVRERACYRYLVLAAWGGLGWRHALWSVPGGSPIMNTLQLCIGGMWPVRWFSQVDPATVHLPAEYRWSAHALQVGALLRGRRLSPPVYAPTDAPTPILAWLREVLAHGGTPHLETFPSSAAQLCRAAAATGQSLAGSHITVLGEPLTPARLDAIRQAGAHAHPKYSTVECGPIGHGCLAPAAADDVHLHDERLALVQPGAATMAAELPGDALLVTALDARTPLILLNASLGDRAVLAPRACGCPLEACGWTTHLHTIRSFEKLTVTGTTVADIDVIRTLEDTLPARFGGEATAYQLVETTTHGTPGLELLVHPAVGPLDETAVREAFLHAVGATSPAARVATLRWRAEALPRVVRRPPLSTANGKILHVHQRDAAADGR